MEQPRGCEVAAEGVTKECSEGVRSRQKKKAEATEKTRSLTQPDLRSGKVKTRERARLFFEQLSEGLSFALFRTLPRGSGSN